MVQAMHFWYFTKDCCKNAEYLQKGKVMNENLVRCKLWRSGVTWLFHEISKKEELDDATDDWEEEESEFDKDCD